MVPRLKALGHDVIISAFYGLQGGVLSWEDIPVYPAYRDPWGNDVLGAYASKFFGGLRDGWVITLMDLAPFTCPAAPEMNLACWVPVDHEPVPPATAERLNWSGALPIAMSKFGKRMLAEESIEARYVPHAIDVNVFEPYDHREAKATLGLPEDAFVVGIVAANRLSNIRKGLAEAVEGFSRFHEDHPEALLLLHAEADDSLRGVHLRHLVEYFGIADAVRFRDPVGLQLGISPQMMAVAYSSMDVLLSPSYGEGFGIPIVEAQACGTPVIATNFSSMPELIWSGWLVEGEPFYDYQRAWFRKPSIDGIVEALEWAFKDAASMRGSARHFARRYDADYIFEEYWWPVLHEMEARLG